MRIAVSGAHATGKSTLLGALAATLPNHRISDELYFDLLGAGEVFPNHPGADEYEFLLDRSIEQLLAPLGPNALFDRAPVDYFAYQLAVAGAARTDGSQWHRMIAALTSLDLLVFLPIQDPDPFFCPPSEQPRLRSRVDALLHDILLGSAGAMPVPVLEVTGSVEDRLAQVLARIGRSKA
jgi:hypothetical protein